MRTAGADRRCLVSAVERAREALSDVHVELLRCPSHGYECLAINDTRITRSKCCGSWDLVKTYRVDLLAANPVPAITALRAENARLRELLKECEGPVRFAAKCATTESGCSANDDLSRRIRAALGETK